MNFYLGTHEPSWLRRAGVPLFVSRRRLARLKRLPRAVAPWALDSGGFSELKLFGRWQTTEAEYIDAVARYVDEVGLLEWAAPMDWMVEPVMLERTGLTVQEHQARTVENFLRLRDTGLPFVPVLQGWTIADYLGCVELYRDAGVDLTAEERVGLGSVCRRQKLPEIAATVRELFDCGLRLHGFGVKKVGLKRVAYALASADSMSWSYRARNMEPRPGCTHASCANCLRWALEWRDEVLEDMGLFAGSAA